MAVLETDLDYWFNWRVLFCAIQLVSSLVIASLILRKYEGRKHSNSTEGETKDVDLLLRHCDAYAWMPCLRQIHPIWLMALRIISFSLLLATLIIKVTQHGFHIYFFYTEWTFTLVTIYFGLGSVLSAYGCYQHQRYGTRINVDHALIDEEQGPYSYMPIDCVETTGKCGRKELIDRQEHIYVQAAGFWSRLLEVIFQICAGAVVLTDCIYWLIIFPFLTIRDYNLNFMTVNVHTLNVILLLGDTALNCLRVPWYGISYFIIWSNIFVIFQWIVHACISIWWPYPFLDLSSPYAPLWYAVMGLMHIPCYGIFTLIIEMKHNILSKLFPQSYQCHG